VSGGVIEQAQSVPLRLYREEVAVRVYAILA